MKHLVFLFVALGAAVVFLAYGPINVYVKITTDENDIPTDSSLSGASKVQAAMRTGTDNDDTFTGTPYRDFKP